MQTNAFDNSLTNITFKEKLKCNHFLANIAFGSATQYDRNVDNDT